MHPADKRDGKSRKPQTIENLKHHRSSAGTGGSAARSVDSTANLLSTDWMRRTRDRDLREPPEDACGESRGLPDWMLPAEDGCGLLPKAHPPSARAATKAAERTIRDGDYSGIARETGKRGSFLGEGVATETWSRFRSRPRPLPGRARRFFHPARRPVAAPCVCGDGPLRARLHRALPRWECPARKPRRCRNPFYPWPYSARILSQTVLFPTLLILLPFPKAINFMPEGSELSCIRQVVASG